MIDWSMVILRIQNKGLSGEKLAIRVNACPVHIRRISRGEVNQPKFNVGVKLLDLHHDLCPDEHEGIEL